MTKPRIPADFQPHPDGKRFHSRTYNGGLFQVYGVDLEHVCECESERMADMVADALNQAAGIADPSAVSELIAVMGETSALLKRISPFVSAFHTEHSAAVRLSGSIESLLARLTKGGE
jgi:hypothetical protein